MQRSNFNNSLLARRPEIAAQWHATKNGALKPADVSVGSGRQVWWVCPRSNEHVWQTRVADRARFGCPYCSGQRTSVSDCLASRFPKLAREWHWQKNGKLRPQDVLPGSNRKVWWLCDRRHEWQAAVHKRSAGSRCPFCSGWSIARDGTNSLALEVPDIAREWHPTKNGPLTPSAIHAGSHRRVWWKCPKGPDHAWEATVVTRACGGRGCPFCAGHRVSVTNALAATRPDLAAEWHPTKNGTLTPSEVTVGAHKTVWWRCVRNPRHQWRAEIHARHGGCPFCSHRKTAREDSLSARMPHIARQWHPTRNGALRPVDVVPGSNRRVWWKCPKGPDHVWSGVIVYRTSDDSGCPFCSNRRLSVTNNLAARHPELVKQWHPVRNGQLKPSDVMPGTLRRVWWRCPAGPDHEWKAQVQYRVRRGSGCPCCRGRKLSVTNCFATKHPRLAAMWHPRLNGKLTPDKIFSSSTTPVWWQCDRRHEWRATPAGRSKKGGGCPICPTSRKQRRAMTYRVREVVRFPGDLD
ncbi:MAG: zinc-ribbon domain-containing protein [Deltaproteobacteria bacterium]|nr:zinc-ribbon domain-containing protein [Deltaproteobacteria bacterium]